MEMPGLLAFYLPQYHHVKENDLWWGEGFTDWTVVRENRPLFKGHQQPRVPLDGNYYDLMEKSAMQHQAELMQKYGLDGMVIYHYWFKDGRQILERPAENLLQWKEIPMNFCFCWANETWARTWSRVMQNITPWMADAKRDVSKDEHVRDDGILLDQRYGDEAAWQKHIEYLIPFFQDPRYLRKDGRPVFFIYRGEHIHCLPEMRACWNRVLQEHGIPGLYLIEENVEPAHAPSMDIDAILVRSYQGESIDDASGVKRLDYDSAWNCVLEDAVCPADGKPVCHVGFVDFDNTPRMGASGLVMDGVTPEKFEMYLEQLIAVEARKETPFVVINAWNEWGEGAYLEPDELRGYQMLEAVKQAKVQASTRTDTSLLETRPLSTEELKERLSFVERRLYVAQKAREAMGIWLSIASSGKHVSDFLKANGYHRIAVYGLGFMGMHLLEDLQACGMEIAYAVDRRKNAHLRDIPVYPPEADLPTADVLVVTPCGQYDEIYAELKDRVPCRMVSIEHILQEMG